ncbi:MAG: hypothetical protein NT084_14710 [Bacteroidetes bacterium]|jgi:hypothetical protein|nr:hypothetical protein [Bacteroidota bacterium]
MKENTFKKVLSNFPQTLFVMLLAFLCISSCKKDEATTIDGGYSYFPNAIGHYCIYEVDSTIYDNFNHDTVLYRYQIKEVIESYFTDNMGRTAMRVERYKRPYIDTIAYANLPWTLSRVWAFTRTNSVAEKLEENQRFVRLAFVPRIGKKWNGNEFNTIGEWDYKYTQVDEPYLINAMSFDSTLTVVQKDEENLLNKRYYVERYARHVGLIEKNVIDVADDSLVIGVPVLNRINVGVIYNIKLVDWGPR